MINLPPFSKYEKPVLVQLLLDYFKEIDSSKIVFNENNEALDYPYLDDYWRETQRHPLKITLHNTIIGFVLINNKSIISEFNAEYSIAEFYIHPTYRRKGFGKCAAIECFGKFPGNWEVKQSSLNTPAIAFWRATISTFTNGMYEEVFIDHAHEAQIIQLFTSP